MKIAFKAMNLVIFLNKLGLATLLERANTQFFKVNFQNFLLFYLWVFSCFKVGDNGLNVKCKGLTLCRVQNPVQIKSILYDISDKVLAAVTVKILRSFTMFVR